MLKSPGAEAISKLYRRELEDAYIFVSRPLSSSSMGALNTFVRDALLRACLARGAGLKSSTLSLVFAEPKFVSLVATLRIRVCKPRDFRLGGILGIVGLIDVELACRSRARPTNSG